MSSIAMLYPYGARGGIYGTSAEYTAGTVCAFVN